MSTIPGLGDNGGPLVDDLALLDNVFSMTIAKTSEVTGLSRSRIYRYLDGGRLRSYKSGKARLILARSLVQLLRELAASPEDTPRYRHSGGRFAPSARASAVKESAEGSSPGAPQHVNLAPENSRDGTYPTTPRF